VVGDRRAIAIRNAAEQPDRIWLTDITEHPTREGKLYLCAIKDVCPLAVHHDSVVVTIEEDGEVHVIPYELT
jgi:hypothetical protein